MTLSDYLRLFPGAEREKPKFMALAGAVLRQAMDLGTLVASLQSGFSFEEAEGAQLDAIAGAVGLSRGDVGLEVSDEELRKYVMGKLALWSWDGTNGGVPGVVERVLAGSREKDNQDGSVTVTLGGVLPVEVEEVFPVTGGVRVV